MTIVDGSKLKTESAKIFDKFLNELERQFPELDTKKFKEMEKNNPEMFTVFSASHISTEFSAIQKFVKKNENNFKFENYILPDSDHEERFVVIGNFIDWLDCLGIKDIVLNEAPLKKGEKRRNLSREAGVALSRLMLLESWVTVPDIKCPHPVCKGETGEKPIYQKEKIKKIDFIDHIAFAHIGSVFAKCKFCTKEFPSYSLALRHKKRAKHGWDNVQSSQ